MRIPSWCWPRRGCCITGPPAPTCPSVWRAPRCSCRRPGEHARLDEEARLGLQGEIDALTSQLVYWTADAERTLALAQRALAVTPIEHSYVRAIARLFAAGALQMRGDIRGAIETLDEGLREDRFGSHTYAPHLLVSFCFIYWVAADLPQLLKTAAHLLELARERNLAESLDWAHYFRGCAHYQQNDLEAAARDFATVAVGARDRPRHRLSP